MWHVSARSSPRTPVLLPLAVIKSKNMYFISPEAKPLEASLQEAFSFDPSHTVQQFCLHLNFSFRSTMQLRAFCSCLSVSASLSAVLKPLKGFTPLHGAETFSYYLFSVAAARCADVISAEQQQFCDQKFRHRPHLETEIFSDSPLKGTQLSIKTF